MSRIKNYLLLVLMAFIAFALVGCSNKLPAPTEITINFEIFDGTEEDPYVLVGNTMYLSSEVNAGADPNVVWSLATTDKATLVEEDGSAVITGLAGGNIEVTCTSAVDSKVSKTVVIEVVPSNDYNAVLVEAYNKIKAELPEYVDANFTLPVIDNPNIKVTYLSKTKDVWADGIFKYTYSGTDADYQFYVRLAYRGVEVEEILIVKVVSDAQNNAFVVLSKAQGILDEYMNKYTSNEEGRVLNETSEGVVIEAEWNATQLPALLLPGSTTAEQTGLPVEIYWEADNGSDATLKLKKYTPTEGEARYYITYEKAEIPTEYLFSAFMKVTLPDNTSKMVKVIYKITGDGFGIEGMVQYFIEQEMTISNPYVLEKKMVSVRATDKTGKFDKLTVEYTSADETIVKPVPNYVTSGTNRVLSYYYLQALSNGTTVVTATFYYNKQEVQVEKIKYDEQGNPMLDENGEVIKETVTEYTATFEYKYEITITVNR